MCVLCNDILYTIMYKSLLIMDTDCFMYTTWSSCEYHMMSHDHE